MYLSSISSVLKRLLLLLSDGISTPSNCHEQAVCQGGVKWPNLWVNYQFTLHIDLPLAKNLSSCKIVTALRTSKVASYKFHKPKPIVKVDRLRWRRRNQLIELVGGPPAGRWSASFVDCSFVLNLGLLVALFSLFLSPSLLFDRRHVLRRVKLKPVSNKVDCFQRNIATIKLGFDWGQVSRNSFSFLHRFRGPKITSSALYYLASSSDTFTRDSHLNLPWVA